MNNISLIRCVLSYEILFFPLKHKIHLSSHPGVISLCFLNKICIVFPQAIERAIDLGHKTYRQLVRPPTVSVRFH